MRINVPTIGLNILKNKKPANHRFTGFEFVWTSLFAVREGLPSVIPEGGIQNQ